MIYFVVCIIIGNMILLNLFMAILINNFVQSRENYLESHSKNLLTYSLETWKTKAERFFENIQKKTRNFLQNDEEIEKAVSKIENEFPLEITEKYIGCDSYQSYFDYRLFPICLNGENKEKNVPEAGGPVPVLEQKAGNVVRGRSFFLFDSGNRFRRWLFDNVFGRKYYRMIFIVAQVLSAFFLVFVDPLKPLNSGFNLFLVYLRGVTFGSNFRSSEWRSSF
jgi:hypothetical protein